MSQEALWGLIIFAVVTLASIKWGGPRKGPAEQTHEDRAKAAEAKVLAEAKARAREQATAHQGVPQPRSARPQANRSGSAVVPPNKVDL